MDTRETGMRNVEELVMKTARGLDQETAAYELLWWPEIPGQAGGAGLPSDTRVPLRLYKGNSWKSIEFAGSDIDGSVTDSTLLARYEDEVARCLREM